MLRGIIHRLLRHRHFWREVGFDELSEIYVSMIFRSMALSLTNIFVPLYMLKQGYPFVDVLILISWYFIFRAVVFDLLSGFLVSKIGPKHTILCSYALLIVSTSLFLSLAWTPLPLWLVGGVWGGTSSLFCIPFDVDFSKIKHKAHGGKELGYVKIMEKIGGIAGPFVGGIIATLFGGQYLFLTAIVMLFVGGLPLLKTKEPVKTHQKFNLGSLDLKRMKRDLLSFIPYGIELTVTGSLWPLYLALFVLASSTAYAGLGILASLSLVASMAAAFIIGKLIDKHRGRQLLRVSATSNAILHLVRPFITTYPAALLVNLSNEGATAGYQMPYTKGMYDAVDSMPEHRTAYFVMMEMTDSATKALFWLSLVFISGLFSHYTVLTVGFVVGGAICSLLIMTEKFVALNARKRLFG